MPKQSTPFNVGPMWSRGDLTKAPAGTSSKTRNCAFRRGVVEKRPGFLYDSGAPQNLSKLFQYDDGTEKILYAGDIATGEGAYRNSNGTWTEATNSGRNVKGAVDYENVLYVLGGEDSGTRQSRVDSLDSATVATSITKTRIGGSAIGTYGGRLLLGSPKFYYSNGGASKFAFDQASEWTVGGSWSQPTGASLRTATVVDGAADTITSTDAVYTTGATEEYVTFVFEIKNTDASNEIPITINVQDAAGTTVYKTTELNVPSASIEGDWQKYTYSELYPASTDLYVELAMGNQTGDATASTIFYLSDATNSHGFAVYPGKLVYPYGAQASVTATNGVSYQNRWYWSEALDFADWRNTNFADVDEVSGDITAFAVVNGRVVVFKEDATWVYRPGPSFEAPFVRESFFPGIGCLGPQSAVEFNNILYFIGRDEIYAFDGGSRPIALAGEGMKDEIFSAQISRGVAAVDTDNREVWFAARAYRIYIYSLDQKQWVGYYQLTDSNASETPFTPYGQIEGLAYMQPRGEDYREMWVCFTSSGSTNTKVAKLRESQTKDDLDGTERDVVAEYTFQPLESGRWRRQVTIQYMGIDHKITGSQAASTTEYAFSRDGGNTWTEYNQVRLPVSSGGAGDTDPIRVPLHQTAPRAMLRIKHTGAAGPAYFNMTGGEASLLIRGEEVQATNPTQVGSNL